MRRGKGDYQTIWGTIEQPTTIVTVAQSGSFGNLVKFRVPGNIVGMRWGRADNVTDKGAIGMVWTGPTGRVPIRVCMALSRNAIGGGGLTWTNMFIHPFVHVVANDTYMFVIHPIFVGLSYNDGALLAADLTIGNFTYPQDTGTARNGATNGLNTLYPTTSANGRRYSLDVLFLPD